MFLIFTHALLEFGESPSWNVQGNRVEQLRAQVTEGSGHVHSSSETFDGNTSVRILLTRDAESQSSVLVARTWIIDCSISPLEERHTFRMYSFCRGLIV